MSFETSENVDHLADHPGRTAVIEARIEAEHADAALERLEDAVDQVLSALTTTDTRPSSIRRPSSRSPGTGEL